MPSMMDMSRSDYRERFVGTTTVLALLFGFLFARVWYLQIYNGRKFKAFSEQNRITIKKIPAMRGRILDRTGAVIADSRPSFDLLVTPGKTKGSLDDSLRRIGELLGWPDQERDDILRRAKQSPTNDIFVIKRDMNRDDVAKLLARQYTLPGFRIIDTPARSFPYGTHGSHYLGYLGEINRAELKHLESLGDRSYQLGDVWGMSGVEKTYELLLRGVDGAVPFVEDAAGRELGEDVSRDLLPAFQSREPLAGNDLVLAIDTRVQEAAEAAFTHERGAVVALDPVNGDVLALFSRPEYAPENFARGVSGDYWKTLIDDVRNPLYDRALRGLYPPGSTFKFITGTALLSEKVADESQAVFCPGTYKLGRETKRCWNKSGHGWMNFRDALKHSCDVYFYEMGRRLGIERIAKHAREFGLGRVTGIGINREVDGLVPTEAWKMKRFKQRWVGGETLSVAIGQGALQVTPLQLSVALSALVNGGVVYRPRLALRAQNTNGGMTKSYAVEERGRVRMDERDRKRLLDALGAVVNEPGGTAYWSARSQVVTIGGKTGTAQVVGRQSGVKIDDHAWFIAFAPVEAPKIVVTVIVENGGHGGTTAAPIAKKMIEAYLGGTS